MSDRLSSTSRAFPALRQVNSARFFVLPVFSVIAGITLISISGNPVQPSTVTEARAAKSVLTATPTPPPCGLTWRVSSANRVGTLSNYLFGILAISSNDLWAVGARDIEQQSRTLILHGDGSNWAPIASPNLITATSHTLADVDGVSSGDVWAVGFYNSPSTSEQTLTQHWDGNQWIIVPSPSVISASNQLLSIDAISHNDVWAVGYAVVPSGTIGYPRTLTQHWDGSQWIIVPSPNLTDPANYLWGVDAVSSDDVWAVGYAVNDDGTPLTMIQHWDGSQWIIVPSPNPPTVQQARLYGVAALSTDDVWAVGHQVTCCTNNVLIEHWDGNQWSIVPEPDPGTDKSRKLNDIQAVSPDNIWAIGSAFTNRPTTLVQHWNGVQWSDVSSPSPGITSYLEAITVVSPSNLWSAGYYWLQNGVPFSPLIEHYSDPCATPFVSPSPAATGTATPATTATVTATPCPMTFTDVHPTDYFYGAVRHLYCMDVISGYSDGTFRPYNNTTRGQLSKIIVLAKQWKVKCPPNGHFNDVPVGDPFYCYIETMFARGVITGYSDGTFRPYRSVTRGQLSHVIVRAMEWKLECQPSGHFSDVQPGDTFFCDIETAYSRGVISGYSDGTFRPGSDATRGQICKIVYNAITAP
jgi:hypothetical protein